MASTPIEIIALLFAALILVKIGVIIFSGPKKWMDTVKPIYANPKTSSIVAVLLALLVFWYLIQELTIVQIFAVIAFTSLLMGLSFFQHSKEVWEMAQKMLKKNKGQFLGPEWLLILVWIVLSVWAIVAIF